MEKGYQRARSAEIDLIGRARFSRTRGFRAFSGFFPPGKRPGAREPDNSELSRFREPSNLLLDSFLSRILWNDS